MNTNVTISVRHGVVNKSVRGEMTSQALTRKESDDKHGDCLTQRAWGSYRSTCWSLGAGASSSVSAANAYYG